MRTPIIVVRGSVLAVAMATVPLAAHPQTGSTAPPPVRAAERTTDITIDGRPDEAAWAAAVPNSAFVQREPREGRPAEHDTEFRVLYDDAAIYVAARMFDDRPETIARQLVRRDERGQFDWLQVAFDPNLDRRTGYRFQVSAAGVQRDEYLHDDSEEDEAWDAVWESAVHIDAEGWTAEIRIPLSQVRYEASPEPQAWGINVGRRRLSSNETTHYALLSRLQAGVVSQFARLEGLGLSESGHRVELRPYVLSRLSDEIVDPANPFRDGTELAAQTGIDVRYGLGSQFALDVTINPDFGQVEADPAVINLTAFETFFDERRPFFVEGARIFDFSLSGGENRLYYSRRVGREPRGNEPDGARFTDVPDQATILGAAKLTGRTTGGLSVGLLAATTARETGRAFLDDTTPEARFPVEPRTHHGVARLQQDFNDGASTLGAIATVLRRELPGDDSFDFLPRTAFNGGVDWEHQWRERTYAFFGYLAASHVRGDEAAMLALQTGSTHYFQRPDARRLSVDSTATSMTGLDWRMTVAKRRGDHWTGSIWAAQVTSGFDVNDLGFSSRQEVLDGGFRVEYQEIEPGSRLRSYSASLSTFHNWTHEALDDVFSWASWGRAHVNGSLTLGGEVELLNYWELSSDVSYRPERMDRTATRGGPLMLSPRSYSVSFQVETDRRRRFNMGPEISYERSDMGGGSELTLGAELSYRATSQLEIEMEPEWSRSRNGAQYVRTSGSLPFDPTYGNRYLFADLERTEVSLETRVNLTVSPSLSLQLFLQPLLSSGDYLTYGQLSRPETFDFDTFEPGQYEEVGGVARCGGGRTCVDPAGLRLVDFDGDGTPDETFADRDFNVRSLIGNAVVRWEYRPGSTLFFVWQRIQEDEISIGNFRLSRDVDALLRAPAENVFMVKVNYWLGF